MKYVIPVVRNNTSNQDIEFFIEDNDSDRAETVTLALRSREKMLLDGECDPTCFATVKTDDLVKALEWLKNWSR